MEKKIASISISGEMTLNLHSLNNEGGEGNQIMTRQLTITDKEGNGHIVNGISGDMFKHIHVGHLVNYCLDKGLVLSDYSRKLNPNRITSVELLDYLKKNKAKNEKAEDVIDALINTCTICDLHGILITDKVGENKNSSNTPRKSIMEFGWTVGIPNKNNTESFVHTKLVANINGDGSGNNEGQNIFHRPVNNGVYAFVCNIDAYRIGFNDISRKRAIDEEEREKRYKALLQSLLSSFINPRGAMTSVQKPHITDFKGVVSISYKLMPAPTVSAINPDYKNEILKIQDGLNKMEPEAIEIKEFDGLGELSKIFVELMDMKPYIISES